MGIEVSPAKVVTINDQHEDGVDTSVAGNPSQGRFAGITLFNIFRRNQRGPRRDDGNPLVHALKGRKGFSIMPFWKQQIMGRARAILRNSKDELSNFDFVVPMPSTSSFCFEVTGIISAEIEAPLLPPDFMRKRRVGEVLADARAFPPKVGRLKTAWASQLYIWERANPEALYQAKDLNVGLRRFVNAFALDGEAPDLAGKRVLVVDDIFATGSSLAAAREIVGNQLGAEVSAAFFLGGL